MSELAVPHRARLSQEQVRFRVLVVDDDPDMAGLLAHILKDEGLRAETRRELESRRLAAEIQRKEAIRGAFARYVSPRLADRIIHELGEGGGPFKGQARRSEIVAMFVDLRSFTRLTELSEVGAVVEMLNEYFSVLTDAAYQHDGTIFNVAGDSLLIDFNVPFPHHDAAQQAYRVAINMVDQFARRYHRNGSGASSSPPASASAGAMRSSAISVRRIR